MKSKKIFKATFLVMVITIASRFLGLIRDSLVAYYFGAGAITDAYKAAVMVPETLFTIIGLGVSTVFIPMLSKIRYRDSKEKMFEFANNVIGLLIIMSLCIFVLGNIFTESIVNIIAPGFSKENMELAISLTRISLINLLFMSVNVCFLSMLQVCEDFVIPSILGMFFNAPIILYLIIFKDVNILGVTIANVIGNILRVVVQIPSLYRQGYNIKFIFKLIFKLNDTDIKRMFVLLVPVIIGAGANSINMVVDTNIGSTLGVGIMSNLEYGQKIISFINTAITTSIVSVMYPLMANKLNEKDNKGFLQYLVKSVVVIAFILMPVAAGIIILNKEVVTIIFARNQFDATAVRLTSLDILGYSLSIPFTGVRDILNSSLFAMEKTKTTAFNGIIGVAINILLNIFLSKRYGIIGVALASSISSVVIAFLLFRATVKYTGQIDLKLLLVKLAKITLTTIMMFIALLVFNYLTGITGVIKIIADAIVGAALYVIISIVLRIEELNEVLSMLKNKVAKGER